MTTDRTIPNNSQHDVVNFDLLSDGNPVGETIEVLSVTVEKEINRIPTAKLVLRDGDAASSNFEHSNSNFFIPGKKLTIRAGLDGNRVQIFEGIVVKHAIKIREQGNTALYIECRDAAVRMTIGRHSRYFEQVKDSAVMEELIGLYNGLRADVSSTGPTHKELVQYHSTDWDFLLARAEANGRLVLVDDGSIQVKKPDTSPEAALEIEFGNGDLLEFEAEMDARTQWQNVAARAWDYASQNLFTADSDSADLTEPGDLTGSSLSRAVSPARWELSHGGHVLEEELNEWVKGQMTRSRLSKVRGRAKFTGYPDIKPGATVELKGVGNRFNGKVYVSAVRHEIYAGSWDTHIQFGLPSDLFAKSPDFYDPQAAGLLPPVHGLQIGKVVQLQDDPDGQHRILVRIPVIDANAQGIWMRVASLDAGQQRGAFFRPEIDDEVVVGFVNDDPRDAIVLGMLHSSAKPAPLTAQDVNHEKGFTTRSKMHLYFNDDTKTIKIDTPAGNSIVIDEASTSIKITDQNNNTITMNQQGIEIKSPLQVKIEAGTTLDIKAGTALTIGGATVAISAQSSFEAKGATAKLSSPGITEVSGSLVKIN
ncbi:MAG TPA: type VI secretion system tip protein VgrG [Saprospiraceae bacterium]|nr:type VI secretion system tip protein VgrG [Saprospiraceae bacterium]